MKIRIMILSSIMPAILASSVFANLPYFTDFSEERGFFSGGIPDSEGWIVRPETTVVATEHSVKAGQAVLLYHGTPPGAMRRGFVPNGSEIVFVDLFVRPVAGEGISDGTRIAFDNAQIAFLKDGHDTTIAVSDISSDRRNQWLDIRYPFLADTLGRSDDWIRITMRLDYSNGSEFGYYNVYIDGEMAEYDLRFQRQRFDSERNLTITGARSSETWVDDIYAGTDNPLFDDPGGTGLPEGWLPGDELALDSLRDEKLTEGDHSFVGFYLSEKRPDYVSSENRLSEIKTGNPVPERQLTVLTRLEKPDAQIQNILKNLKE